ncbi:MAG TPA: hypothetical protein VFB20_14810 [Burkholderiales bacterium]|nr:hypothetical protein [Burkholderiales bacterium]
MRTLARAAAAAAILCLYAVAGHAERGELIWRDPSCYFFVLKTDNGYGLFEFLGGPSPMVGHIFEGKLEAFGTRKIDNATEGKPTMVYSEVFEASEKLLLRKIPPQCKHKKELEAAFEKNAAASAPADAATDGKTN